MMMEDEAKRAIMELNGCMLNGNRLNVEVPENHICVIAYNVPFKLHFAVDEVHWELDTIADKFLKDL